MQTTNNKSSFLCVYIYIYVTYMNYLLNRDDWSDDAEDEVKADEEPAEWTLHGPSVKYEQERDAEEGHRVVQ